MESLGVMVMMCTAVGPLLVAQKSEVTYSDSN